MEFALRYNPRILDTEQIETLLGVLRRGVERHPVLKEVRVYTADQDSRLANETIVTVSISRKHAKKDVRPGVIAEQVGEMLSSMLDGNLKNFHTRVEVKFGKERKVWKRP